VEGDAVKQYNIEKLLDKIQKMKIEAGIIPIEKELNKKKFLKKSKSNL
jgi:hypothetical protein